MGTTYVTLKIKKDRKSKRFVEMEFLVDSGASFTVAPAKVLKGLGVEPDKKQSFLLANGEKITRAMGEAFFEFEDKSGYSKVIFGQRGDSALLGALTLETFGLVLDPLKRKLKPMPMLLM